jgi:lipoate synthase
VARFVPPATSTGYKQVAERMGFLYVAAGPWSAAATAPAEFFMKGLMEQGRHA